MSVSKVEVKLRGMEAVSQDSFIRLNSSSILSVVVKAISLNKATVLLRPGQSEAQEKKKIYCFHFMLVLFQVY